MTWNTRDLTDAEEDKHWEMTDEDTDDEFDDIALARLGVDLPECAREDQFIVPLRPLSPDMTPIIESWREMIENTDLNPEIRAAMASVIDPDGNINFGDEPQGIDPVAAGFDGAEVWINETAETETCWDCGHLLIDCNCDDYS